MKFVIFDIDGTLANTKKVEDKCFMQAFEQTFGLDIYHQKWENIKHVTDWGITEEIILREKQRVPTKEEYGKMLANFIDLLEKEKQKDPKQFSEIPGARNFFYKLQENKNIHLGIATGSWEKSARLKLAAINIKVDDICFSNSDYDKSREVITKEVIHQLSQRSQRAPDEIIYFGDGEWDYKTCKNLGVSFIGIDHEDDGKLSALGARFVFQNYLDPKPIIQALHL